MGPRALMSVGVDVGTTTTQMVVSELTVEDAAGFGALPRLEITGRRVAWESPIAFTPLRDREHIDRERLERLIASFYRAAGVSARSIDTGAVIVTGESARTENARSVAEVLARHGGDFVVVTAGPDFEAVLAGMGSGARDLSRTGGSVLAIDVGGGTANAAVFEDGRVADAFALDVGGRLVRAERGIVTYCSDRLSPLLSEQGIDLACWDGIEARAGEIWRLADALADVLVRVMEGDGLSAAQASLWIGHGAGPGAPYGRVLLSGGVGACVYQEALRREGGAAGEPDQVGAVRASFARYGDMGPLLASAILRRVRAAGIDLARPRACRRATVIGAGAQSMTLSGSTVFAADGMLPLRNLPIIDVFSGDAEDYGTLADRIARERRLHDGERAAVFFRGPEHASRRQVVQIARELRRALAPGAVVLVEGDFAKALGQQLAVLGLRRVVVLDGISVGRGDYIDIGRPVGGAVSVVVKTIAFR